MTDSAMANVLLQGQPGPPGEQGDAGTAGSNASASAAWPIGSVFLSVVSTNPATLLGFGTWSAIAAGRTLVGLNSSDTDFDVVEETGGAKTVQPSGTVSQPTFTGTANQATNQANIGATGRSTTTSTCTIITHTHTITATGVVSQPTFTGVASSVVQPYYVVYMWKRTA
jgi:hypothetical protein